jgi:hypothetical protein
MLPSAALPNFAEPGVIGLGAILGGFIGHTAAWIGGGDEDARVRQSVVGSYYGTAIAIAIYLLTNVRATGTLWGMFRTWAIPYGVAMAILAPLILVGNAPAWGRGAMWAIFIVVLVSTYCLHLWMEDREIGKRRAGSDRRRRRGAR